MTTTEGAALDRKAVGRVDSSDQATDILAIPEHLRDALWKVESAGLTHWDSPWRAAAGSDPAGSQRPRALAAGA